jgi:hypothetical protein
MLSIISEFFSILLQNPTFYRRLNLSALNFLLGLYILWVFGCFNVAVFVSFAFKVKLFLVHSPRSFSCEFVPLLAT